MALTVTMDENQICPGIRFGSVAFDTSYATGGEALDLSAWFDTVEEVFFEVKGLYIFEYFPATGLVMAYTKADGAEVGDGSNISSACSAVHFIAHGKP